MKSCLSLSLPVVLAFYSATTTSLPLHSINRRGLQQEGISALGSAARNNTVDTTTTTVSPFSFKSIEHLIMHGIATIKAHIPQIENYLCAHVPGHLCDPNSGQFIGAMAAYANTLPNITRQQLESAICITGGNVCGNVDVPFVIEGAPLTNRTNGTANNTTTTTPRPTTTQDPLLRAEEMRDALTEGLEAIDQYPSER